MKRSLVFILILISISFACITPSTHPKPSNTPEELACPTEEMLVSVMESVLGINPDFTYDPDTPEWDKSYTEYADPYTVGLFSIDVVNGCVVSMGVATITDIDSGDFTLAGAYQGVIYAIGTEDFVVWLEKESARCAIADTEEQKTANNGDMWQFSCEVNEDYWINVITFQSNY